MDEGLAPAKVNLALHVTGLGADGYHRLDSLVAFAGVGDRVEARPAPNLTLAVAGPFAPGVPTDGANLVLRAAHALRAARGVTAGAAIRLDKRLPHAAGVGSASSDAAAALRVLARLWGVEPLAPGAPAVLALGSDVPACLHAPAPLRMRGRGERIERLPPLPALGLVLLNPGVPLATKAVFDRLASRDNPPLPPLPPGLDAGGFAAWLGTTRNDLQPPAEALAPAVGTALALLRRAPGALAAMMSGSGATCVAVTRAGDEAAAAAALRRAAPGWWVAAAPLLAP